MLEYLPILIYIIIIIPVTICFTKLRPETLETPCIVAYFFGEATQSEHSMIQTFNK